jgi:hypothetical protein
MPGSTGTSVLEEGGRLTAELFAPLNKCGVQDAEAFRRGGLIRHEWPDGHPDGN